MTDHQALARGLALVRELKRRYDGRSVMNPTGSILLSYEEAPTIIAALEAAECLSQKNRELEGRDALRNITAFEYEARITDLEQALAEAREDAKKLA